jgi:hypothetical protein
MGAVFSSSMITHVCRAHTHTSTLTTDSKAIHTRTHMCLPDALQRTHATSELLTRLTRTSVQVCDENIKSWGLSSWALEVPLKKESVSTCKAVICVCARACFMYMYNKRGAHNFGRSVCVCACMRVFWACFCMCVSVYAYMWIWVRTCFCAHACVFVCVCECVYVCVCVSSCHQQ